MNTIYKFIKRLFKIEIMECPNCKTDMKECGEEYICPKCGYQIYNPGRHMGRF